VTAEPAGEPLVLAGEFPTATAARWGSLVVAALRRSGVTDAPGADRGGDPVRELSTRTYDGIDIAPLYTAGDARHAGVPGRAPFTRGATAEAVSVEGWDVRQRHAEPDPDLTNTAVLADLANGATSLWLVLGDGGLAIGDLPAALHGVYFELAPVALDAGAKTREAAAAFLRLARERGLEDGELAGTLGADPIGLKARTGAVADLAELGELSQMAAGHWDLRVATVDGTIYHDAGGGDADELAVATSVGVAYLRVLTESGCPVDAALDALEFRYAVTDDQFLSAAKLRAARRMWDRVAELSGGSRRRGQRQHAVTSAAMMTARDPWVNLLRTTIACFAAAVGGAEAITVRPFDAAIGLPDDFARRLARNTQSILHDESGLARVVDAAGGSWYVESLTDSLAEKAWATFTAIERAGGASAALDSGMIPELLAHSAAERRQDVAHRRAPITGVSEFALIAEPPVVRAPSPPAPGGGPLPVLRYAEEFEALRDRSDAAPRRPTVFLAALGPLPAHSRRVAFAANLFQSAGITPVTAVGDLLEVVAAFRQSGAAVVCLCSSDKVYAELAAPVATALKTAGASHVWRAGRFDASERSDREAGVDGYLYDGCDALSVLRTTLECSGVR
jgi:methylmalonyl-CoA mutase